MKLLVFVNQFHAPNGSERLAIELAEELNRRGIPADILSMYGEDLPGVELAKSDLLRRGIPSVHYLGLPVHPPLAKVMVALWRLRRLLRTESYSVVETSHALPSILASWATRGLTTRHVQGVHNVFRRDRFNSIRHRVWRFSTRGSRCARFYAISDTVRDAWVDYTKCDPGKTVTIHNGIPDDCFDASPERVLLRQELGIPEDTKIALFVGRLLMRKGIDTLLDALGPILAEECMHLVYVGEWYPEGEGLFAGEKTIRQTLENQIAEWGIQDSVSFLGRRNDVPRLMASSDVLVHPARIEGFGLILVEAMAAGLPVVASNVDGIPEVLTGTESTMVPPDDPEALREAVLRTLHRSAEEKGEAAVKGRQRAEMFRARNRIDALVRLFELVEKEQA